MRIFRSCNNTPRVGSSRNDRVPAIVPTNRACRSGLKLAFGTNMQAQHGVTARSTVFCDAQHNIQPRIYVLCGVSHPQSRCDCVPRSLVRFPQRDVHVRRRLELLPSISARPTAPTPTARLRESIVQVDVSERRQTPSLSAFWVRSCLVLTKTRCTSDRPEGVATITGRPLTFLIRRER